MSKFQEVTMKCETCGGWQAHQVSRAVVLDVWTLTATCAQCAGVLYAKAPHG